VGAQAALEEVHELAIAPVPAVRHLEVHHRAFDVGEADPDEGAVLVLLLAHHEDPVRPEEKVAGEEHGRKGGESGRADLVALVVAVQLLRGAAAVDVGGADEEDALPVRDGLPPDDCTRFGW
jgi:hypothetical protein